MTEPTKWQIQLRKSEFKAADSIFTTNLENK